MQHPEGKRSQSEDVPLCFKNSEAPMVCDVSTLMVLPTCVFAIVVCLAGDNSHESFQRNPKATTRQDTQELRKIHTIIAEHAHSSLWTSKVLHIQPNWVIWAYQFQKYCRVRHTRCCDKGFAFAAIQRAQHKSTTFRSFATICVGK